MLNYHEKKDIETRITNANEKLKEIGEGNHLRGLQILKLAAAIRQPGYTKETVSYADSLEFAREMISLSAIKGEDDLHFFWDLMRAQKQRLI